MKDDWQSVRWPSALSERRTSGEPTAALLIKFGNRPNLEAFRSGTIFMNSAAYFARLEHDTMRRDKFEGTFQICQPKDILELRLTNEATGSQIDIAPSSMLGPVRIGPEEGYNLFCMYAVTELAKEGSLEVDERNFAFGESFCIVTDGLKFAERVSSAIQLLGFAADADVVQYYDETIYSGETGPFRKPAGFSFQREFRIAIYTGLSDPLRLSVGDLSDIMTPIYPLANINHIVSIRRRNQT